MHNDDIKKGIQLALAAVCLLSGVVCGTAGNGTSTSTMSFAQVLMKPDLTDNLSFGFGTEGSTRAATDMSTSQIGIALPEDYSADVKLSSGYKLVERAVRAQLRQGRPTAALKFLSLDPTAKNLKNSEFDRVKAQIAQSYLIEGKIDRAAAVAEEIVQRSGKLVPLSGWVAGQAAWRQGDFGRAADMFAMTARSKVASPWLSSGGAFWAARSSFRAGRFSDVKGWHEKAAEHPRTFYGMVALKSLGRDYDFNRDIPVLSSADRKSIDSSASVQAAIEHTRNGSVTGAIESLSKGGWLKNDETRAQVLAYVSEKNVPALVLFLARKTKSQDGRFYDLALYPESPWEPKNGYQVDKAIVHALIRQESRFNPHATSTVGAKGLMQLMPETAKFVAKAEDIALTDPLTNVEIGQKYVGQLLRDPVVNNDLFKMAIAYNAGPGNLSKWKKQLSDIDDPLLFIESIPSSETRAFVERVMVNYWMYRTRMGQDVPSLEAVASLDRPDYLRVAQNIGANIFALATDTDR